MNILARKGKAVHVIHVHQVFNGEYLLILIKKKRAVNAYNVCDLSITKHKHLTVIFSVLHYRTMYRTAKWIFLLLYLTADCLSMHEL